MTAQSAGSTGPSGSALDDLDSVLDSVRARVAGRADLYEVRAEASESVEYAWTRGALRGAGTRRLSGVSVRVWVGGQSGFASTHKSTPVDLDAMIEQALAIAEANSRHDGSTFPFEELPAERKSYRVAVSQDPFDAEINEVATLLERTEAAALETNKDLHVRAAFAASRRRVRYADSGGREAEASFLLSTLMAYAVHRDAQRPGDGQEWIAGERGLSDFGDDGPERIGHEAAAHAIEASSAKPAPVGRHRVLCDNTLSGLLAHESFGHLTEYDLVKMKWSRLHGCLGQTFAGEHVSIVDAPTVEASPLDGVRIPVDDEGVEGRPVRILDRGTLAHWLHVRGSAPLEDHAPTGNGRAMNSRWSPIVRMRNTFFEPGDLTREEALEELDDGVYLIGGRGGAPSSGGEFMFTAIRGYLVRDGEIEAPLRPTAISGNIFDFLAGVRGLTKDFHVTSTNFGGCGKWGQSYIPVGMGGPHVLVEGAQLGGSA